MKNVALLVDTADTYYRVGRKFKGRKLSYAKLLAFAQQYGSVVKALAYCSQPYSEAAPFVDALRHLGYEASYRRPYADGSSSWGAHLAADLVRVAEYCETIVLVSCDPRLAPVVNMVREDRCVVVLGCAVPFDLRGVEVTEKLLEEVSCV